MQHVLGALVGAVTDLGHQGGAVMAATGVVVNSLGLAPAGAHLDEEVALRLVRARLLVADELLRPLLDDLALDAGLHHLGVVFFFLFCN